MIVLVVYVSEREREREREERKKSNVPVDKSRSELSLPICGFGNKYQYVIQIYNNQHSFIQPTGMFG